MVADIDEMSHGRSIPQAEETATLNLEIGVPFKLRFLARNSAPI